MNLPWIEKIRRADRDNTIDVYISEDYDDVLADGIWQQFFTEKPEVLTREEKRAWLDTMTGVALGSDAFFPFGDNIERAQRVASAILHNREVQYVMIMLSVHATSTIWQWHSQAFACSIIKKIDHFLFHISPFIMRRRQIFHYKWGFLFL